MRAWRIKLKFAIYYLNSTMDKTIDTPLSDFQQYCDERGFEIYRMYCDEGIPGKRNHRLVFDELMTDARKRKFDAVLCRSLSCFASSTKHLINALDELHQLGIDFISLRENIDSTSTMGKAMLTMVSAIAELERNSNAEKIKNGLRKAKERGVKLGRRPLIDERLLWTISHMRGQGMSIRQIAKAVRVSKSLVHKCLKNYSHSTSRVEQETVLYSDIL